MTRWSVVSALTLPLLACAVEEGPDDDFDFSAAELGNNEVCGPVAFENQPTTITCPSGSTISKVVFASYGTPTGTCGSFTRSSCHSGSSKSVVEKACVGKSTCTVNASNGVFGDPCVGTYKRLAVQVECEAPSGGGTTQPTQPTQPSQPTQPTPSVAPTPTSVLPIPTGITNGATVNLKCGQTYQGTLNLTGKSNVTVKTDGTCGKANITPGRAVTGWTQYKGNIYSAPIGFTPVHVAVAGKPVEPAHWPNRPQIWANPGTPTPSSDLAGATLVYLENQSVIRSQTINGNSVGSSKPFYVEGKLWMLDTANEWAVSNGRLYVWAADGLSPEGRVWAASNENGINAGYSTNITVSGVRIFSAYDGISADTSSGLRVIDSEILNSAHDGIWASGSSGLVVDRSSVVTARRTAINGWYWVTGAKITNTTVANSGVVGMPSETQAGIMFGDGSDNLIDKVSVTNSGYHGISVLHNRNTTVSNSVVDGACVTLADCGGIYTGARDKLPLTLQIKTNKVTNVRGVQAVGIYLDDFANGVTVSGNTVSDTATGVVVHNGFDNVFTNNTIASNSEAHFVLAQDSGNVRNNKVTNNVFKSTKGEFTFKMETGSNLKTFATYDNNTYTSTNPAVFGRIWDGRSDGVTLSYAAWKSYTGQDKGSTMNGAP